MAAMPEALRARLLRWLRVPAEPAAPPGDPAGIRTFLASRQFLRYRTAVWALKQLSALAALLFWFFVLSSDPIGVRGLARWITIAEVMAWLGFLAQLPLTFALLRLDYEMRWYILSDRSLRIREGVLTVREKTMTFANVQNITIRQNPLQRFFGIADVRVRAAGGGSAPSGSGSHGAGTRTMHEAVFEGVDNAALIRTTIRDRLRRYRDAGLGDPDEAAAARPAAGTDVVAPPVAAPRVAAPAANQPALLPTPHAPAASAGVSRDALAAAHAVLEEVRALRAQTR
jgi:uncharacterized membrane protein YdbT with pleckstrin-like domain